MLLNDATLPTASDLPEEMWPFLDRQVLEMTERHWSADYGKLRDAIRKEVRRRRKSWRLSAAIALVALIVTLMAVYLTTKKPLPNVGPTTKTSAPNKSVMIESGIDPRWPRGIGLNDRHALENLTSDISFGLLIVGSPTFDKLWQGAHDRHLLRGASRMYDPAVNPALQAEEFVRTVRPGPDDLLGVNIYEHGGGSPAERSRNLHRFLDRVERLTGKRCLIYVTDAGQWDALFDSSFGDYPLMIPGPPARLPLGWKRVAVWVGPRGMNALFVFNGTKDELLALARPRT